MYINMHQITPAFAGILGASIAALVAIIGWLISHNLTIRREINSKIREQHLIYLIQTYRALSKMAGYDVVGRLHDIGPEIQQAIADIQFLGTVEQINYSKQIVELMLKKESVDLTPLLSSLRDELRRSLKKEKITTDINWLFIVPKDWLSILHKEEKPLCPSPPTTN